MAAKKILLIDDEADLRETLAYRLECSGYEVLTASGAEEGLVKALEQPRLILLDIMMPEIDGFEVLSRLKKRKETKNIPVVMLTCRRSIADINQAIDLGAADYLMKPVESVQLLAVVNKYIL